MVENLPFTHLEHLLGLDFSFDLKRSLLKESLNPKHSFSYGLNLIQNTSMQTFC